MSLNRQLIVEANHDAFTLTTGKGDTVIAEIVVAIDERQRLAFSQSSGRPGERLPASVRYPLQQEQLDPTARRSPRKETSGQDSGVVDDEEISGLQQFRQIAEDAILKLATGSPDDEQPGRVARFDRPLRDQVRRQIVVEPLEGDRIGTRAGHPAGSSKSIA
jgi:hypothetical protein